MKPNLEPGSRGDRAWSRGRVKLAVALVSVALVSSALPALPLSASAVMAASPAGTVTNYTNPGIKSPFRIALGSDGAMWYTNSANNSIGRVATDGTVTNYGGVGINQPTDIVTGPDGAMWFTNFRGNSIGRITTAGTVTNYTDAEGGIAEPYSITLGSDGALWFTNRYGNPSIGRIDPTSKAVTHVHTGDAIPGDIAAGSDGALWFTGPLSFDQSTIWRMTPAGELTSYTDYAHLNGAEDIVAGPDGALWVTQGGDATIGRITTSGVVTSYPSGGVTGPVGIAVGSDGALWFTSPGGPSIGRITTAGVVTTFTGAGSSPQGIAAGSDGSMWFTSSGNDSIGRITAGGVVTTYAGVGIADPQAIALGSDGALWFTDHDNNSLGRVTTGGFVTTITDPGISGPYDIVAAPDGALWFTNQGNHTIGRLDLTTGIVSNYTGGYNGNWISTPLNITVGPDRALWFTSPNPGLGSIARMTLDGTVTARYIGSSDTYDINEATDIVTADGALWYVNMTSVGRITTLGATSHWCGAGSSYFARGLTAGPDGALWLTTMGSAVERLSTDVALEPRGPAGSHWTDYPDAGIASYGTITAGPDGALWFTNPGNNTIGRITTGGTLSRYTGTGISTPKGITAGPDGAVWFTNPGNNTIGRIESGTVAPQATAPSAPTMDTPSAGDGSVTLAWTAPSSNGGSPITGYKVYQGTTAGGEGTTPVATLGGSATGTEIGSLTNGTPYYFTVRAINAVGDGAASNEVSATPAALLTGTLSITGPTSGRYGESVQITVSGSSGTGALGFDAASSTACKIDGGNVEISAGSGSCTITATRTSDGVYASTTSDPFSITVGPASLTVTAQDRTITYGQATPDFGVSYSGLVGTDSASSLTGTLGYTFAGISPTVYASSGTAPTHAGTYLITPSGLTSDNYAISFAAGTYTINAVSVNTTLSSGGITPNPATVGQPVSFPGTLAKPYVAGQSSTISDTNLTVQLLTWGDAACSFGSGYNVRDEQAIDATGHVTLHYTPPNAGTYHVSLVFQPQTSGDSYYGQSSSACLALTVNPAKLDQTISFAEPTDVHYGDANSDLGATATSGLTVSYASSTPSVCTIVSDQLHVVAPGSCTITASQVGNTAYNAAPYVPRTFTIAKAAQATLTISAPTDATYGAANATITTSGGSGSGAVTFSSSTTAVCTIVDGRLHVVTGTGTCSITATRAADANHTSAISAAHPVTIAKAAQAIIFTALPDKVYGEADFTVGATASSGLAVSFSASGNCSVSGTTVHLTAAGTCTVTVSQIGDADYNAASNVARTFAIAPAVGTVAYIGQTLVVTSGPNSSTAQVALSASVVATAGSIANARVTFTDDLTGMVLARGVAVSPVVGARTPTGTASRTVTLSSGKFGAQSYRIRVRLDPSNGSSYDNVEQLTDPTSQAYAMLTVIVPGGTNTAKGDADLQPLAPAGTYGSGANIHYTIGLKYSKGGSNPQGQILLGFDFDGYRFYVKSNSISSIVCTKTGSPCRDLTIYTKASIYRIDALGQTTSIDGNVTVRVDAHDADGSATGDTIGFTVLSSKSGMLYYSNNWTYDPAAKAWRTVQQPVSATNGVATQIN